MATIRLPGQRKLPWKVMLLVATLLAALAVGVMAATMLIGGSGSTPTTEATDTGTQPNLAPSLNDQPSVVADDPANSAPPMKQVADQPFPTTVGELRAMGPDSILPYSHDSKELEWGWGKFDFENILGDGSSIAAHAFRGALYASVDIASTPKWANRPYRTFADGVWDPKEIQAARELAERIFVITSQTDGQGNTGYTLEQKNLLYVQLEPDKIYGIFEEYIEFSLVVTIAIEGEEDVRFRIMETLPYQKTRSYDPGFQILN